MEGGHAPPRNVGGLPVVAESSERAEHRSRKACRVAFVLGLTAWCALIAASPAHSVTGHEVLPNLARTFGSGLFLVAGALYLARCRLADEPRTAHISAALIVLGVAVPAVPAIGPLLHESQDMSQSAPSTRAIFLIPVFALLLRSSRAVLQRTAGRFVLGLVTVSGLGLVATLAARRLGDVEMRALWWLIAACSAACWLLVAQRASRPAGVTTSGHLAAGFALLAAAQLVRAWSVAGASAAVGIAPGLQLGAALLIAYAAARSLRHAHASQATTLSRAVVQLKADLDALEAAQRERLHDARSAMVGVVGASELLTGQGSPIEPTRLSRLMAAELKRLQGMLDVRSVEPLVAFDLAAALAPIILVRQIQGSDVDSTVENVRVVGRPLATATVLDNLLRNAAVHAPGARIWIRTERCGSRVHVVIEDDGPGIPIDERPRVLRRGVQGTRTSSPGDGLGLYTSATWMSAQGGTLELGDRPGGGTRVTLALPAALPVAPHALAS